MHYNFMSFVTKHWRIICLLFLMPIGAICLFFFLFHGTLTPSDWMSFGGAVLTYMGTVLISMITLYQAERANIISEQSLELATRPYRVDFQISHVDRLGVEDEDDKENSPWKDIMAILFFCEAEENPESLWGYKFILHNYGSYPITHVMVKGFGYNETHGYWKELERDMTPFIEPNSKYAFSVAYPSQYHDLKKVETYQITCSNIYKLSCTVELKISWCRDNGRVFPVFTQRQLEECNK